LRQNRVAVWQRSGGVLHEVRSRTIPGDRNDGLVRAIVLTHDEKNLMVTTQSLVSFLDVEKLTSGDSNPVLGVLSDRRFSGTGFMAVTPDDKYLFVNQEYTQWLTLIDLKKARATKFSAESIVGGMPTGLANQPVVSTDGRYLYLPSLWVEDELHWPGVCQNDNPRGAVLVLDLQRAGPDLKSSAIATIPGGCRTRRVAVSPDGTTLYAIAVADNTLLAFDLRPLRSGSPAMLIGKVPVPAPSALTLIRGGKQIVVATSNSLVGLPTENDSLTVIDAERIAEGAKAVLGTIPVKRDPRSFVLTADEKTLFVGTASPVLEVIDLDRLQLQASK
jgi:DNA-binding beta-propeller fold protein YncE